MKSALGGSQLLVIVVFFVGAIIFLFASILSYSKAYRVKNRIIEIIEANEGYDAALINPVLTEMGYKPGTRNCTDAFTDCISPIEVDFNYCICEYPMSNDADDDRGSIYEVVTYVRFEFPIIGDILSFPVRSQSKIIGNTYDYD